MATWRPARSPQPPEGLGRPAHGGEQPAGGGRRGVAGPARVLGRAGYVRGFAGDQLHVGHGRADVLGGDVGATKGLDGAAVGAHEALGLERTGVADDDALAAAEVEPGGGVLAGHGAGEAEGVREGVLLRRVGVEARASERRPEDGRVHGDDGLQPRLAIAGEENLLVTTLIGCGKYVHRFDGSAGAGAWRVCGNGK